jgi:trehalose/maltose transport system permease protein
MAERAAIEPEEGVQSAPGRTSNLTKSRTRTAWLLLVPTLLVVAVVAAFPLGQTIYLSFTNERLADLRGPEWIGLDNYQRLFSDDDFHNTIWVTVRFTFITIIAEFILGLVVALVVNSQFKGRGLMRTAMLVPWAIPTVVSAQMWAWMYNDIYGVFNDLLNRRLGLIDQNIAWIADPDYALWAVAAVDIWKTTPFVALLLLAGLQVIPEDIYEAARVDGANKLQQFYKITLPLLVPAIVVTLIFRTLDALRVFDVFYVMFGARRDTMPMAVYAQNTIVAFSRTGYGSAIAVAIFLIISIFVVIYVTTLRVERS